MPISDLKLKVSFTRAVDIRLMALSHLGDPTGDHRRPGCRHMVACVSPVWSPVIVSSRELSPLSFWSPLVFEHVQKFAATMDLTPMGVA